MILARIELMIKTIVMDVSSSGDEEKMLQVIHMFKLAAYELSCLIKNKKDDIL